MMPANENELLGYADEDYKERYGFSDKTEYAYKAEKGLSENVVKEISKIKGEPDWMLEKRLTGYKVFKSKPVPTWGADLSGIDFDDVYYYMKPGGKKEDAWDKVPDDIKRTFDKLGIPEAERKFFAGAEIQYDSEVVYGHVKEELEKQGVIFTDTDTAVKKYPELVKKYFGTVIPPTDNKFAALNTAVFSGGSFIFVPKGAKVAMPLQAYFRINAEKAGQFERTLIIADEGSEVTYLEGCTAPVYIASSLHSAVVEIIVHKDAHVRYVTIQNWSRNVYNLVTQRAFAYENAHMEWIDANIGSKVNMKYPSVYLKGRGASGEILSVAVAGENQVQDSGGKMLHLAPDTTSKIISKSVSKKNGVASYRGQLYVSKSAANVKSTVRCVKPETIILGDNKPIMKYSIGDNSVGPNGLNLVKQTFTNKFEGDMLKIKGCGMFPIEVTPEHPFLSAFSSIVHPCIMENGKHTHLARIKLNNPSWKLAIDLKEKSSFENGDYLLVPRHIGNLDVVELDLTLFVANKKIKILEAKNHSIKVRLDEDLAWALGLYVAEGYIDASHIRFAISANEQNLRDRITEVFRKLNYKTSSYKVDNENAIEVYVHASVMGRAFESWCGHGAANKKIPDFILFNKNERLLKSFLEGYLSGDGCVTTNCMQIRNVTHAVTISKILAIQLQLAGARLGTFFRITKASKANVVQGRVVNIHEKYDVRASGGNKIQVRFDDNFMYVPVRKIERIPYKGDVYNLETSDHTYLISNAISHNCDALLLNKESKTNTYPYMDIQREDATITHEAAVGKIGEEQLFYLMSRGLTEEEALTTVVLGFLDPLTKALPMEYSVELKRLIKLDTTGSVA